MGYIDPEEVPGLPASISLDPDKVSMLSIPYVVC